MSYGPCEQICQHMKHAPGMWRRRRFLKRAKARAERRRKKKLLPPTPNRYLGYGC